MKRVWTIGVLSDTHLRQVTRDFLHIFDHYLADTDLVLHAGDVVSPDIIDFLSAGNMDPPILRDSLPEKKVIQVAGYRLGLIHGWGSPEGLEDRIGPLFGAVDVIVYGHSHVAANHLRNGILFFNPGTATGYSSSGEHSIGILELGETIRGRIIRV